MKWMIVVLTILITLIFYREVAAKTPKTIILSEAEIGVIHTAIGYTTMLQFEGRATLAVLGDQDAFRVEYVGNGLAIKPIVSHAKTNLFVFTDYDRFNFQLETGAASGADYVLKIMRRGYPVHIEATEKVQKKEAEESQGISLTTKYLSRRSQCGGLALTVEAIAWPKSNSTYLVQFSVEQKKSLTETAFVPGDFYLEQNGKSVLIESLHLDGLVFSLGHKKIHGTVVLRQSDIKQKTPLILSFLPRSHRKQHTSCPRVIFSRSESSQSTTKK